jgi:hypothetical protein
VADVKASITSPQQRKEARRVYGRGSIDANEEISGAMPDASPRAGLLVSLQTNSTNFVETMQLHPTNIAACLLDPNLLPQSSDGAFAKPGCAPAIHRIGSA